MSLNKWKTCLAPDKGYEQFRPKTSDNFARHISSYSTKTY